ncbi:MAG: SNF2-related protein [Akkermansia sp.]|nr:SNF2-related protein [Akkermansia sp.]
MPHGIWPACHNSPALPRGHLARRSGLFEKLGSILRPYQMQGVGYMWRAAKMGMGVFLADDMGLGKTLQMLTVLNQWKREGALGPEHGAPPALLVLPATLLANWQAEARKFTPDLRVGVLHASAWSAEDRAAVETDLPGFLARYDVVLTTYGMAARMEGLQEVEFAAVVADEAQAIKTAGSARSRAVRKLKAPRRVALTGTPVENNLGDLWSLFEFINPGLLGSQKGFRDFVRSMGGAHPGHR